MKDADVESYPLAYSFDSLDDAAHACSNLAEKHNAHSDALNDLTERIEALEAVAEKLRASPLALQLGLEDDGKPVSRPGCADAANRKTAEAAPSGSAPLDSAQPAPGNLTIRLRLDRDQWTARSVEYDIAGQGDTTAQALQSWALCFELHRKQGLENVPPMPEPSAASGRQCPDCGVLTRAEKAEKERDAARAESASQRVRAVKAEEALQTSRELCDVLRESERELRARVDELEAADKAWIDSSKYVANMKRRTDAAEEKLALAEAVIGAVREMLCHRAPEPHRSLSDALAAYDAALKAGDEDGTERAE